MKWVAINLGQFSKWGIATETDNGTLALQMHGISEAEAIERCGELNRRELLLPHAEKSQPIVLG